MTCQSSDQGRLDPTLPAVERDAPDTSFDRHDAAVLALLTLVVVTWRGYDLGDSNAIQLAVLRRALDPTLYARDLLVTSLPGYATFFYSGLAAVARRVGHLESLLFGLYALFHGVAVAAVYAVGRLLFANRGAALLACGLYVTRPFALGAEYMYWTRLTHAHVATALLAWALWLYLRGRVRSAFLAIGLVANLHALYAAHLAALLGLSTLLRLRELGLRRVLETGALCLAAAAPVLAWTVAVHEPLDPARRGLWLTILRVRSALHTFPFSIPPAVFGSYLLLVALGWLAVSRLPRDGPRRVIRHVALGAALLCLAALAFSELWPVPVVLRAQLLRSTRWLTFLGLPYLARFGQLTWARGGLSRAGTVAAAAALFSGQNVLLAVALVLVLFDGCWRVRGVLLACAALLLAALSGALAVPRHFGLPLIGDMLSSAAKNPFLLWAAALGLLLRAARFSPTPLARRAVPFGVVAAVVLGLLPWEHERVLADLARNPWTQMQLWARDHTPRDALFLTPPYREGFRAFSERAIVGEWKDGTQQFFSSAFAFEWWRRMRVLKGRYEVYDELSPEAMLVLARDFQADYVVVRAPTSLAAPQAYRSESFAVYGPLTAR